MDRERANKDVVRRFLGAVEAGDLDTVIALQAPGCTWWILGSGEMSSADYTEAVRTMLLTADSRQVEIDSMVADGDDVAVELRSKMQFGDRVYANTYHDRFVVRDGLIVHGREYFDTAVVQAFYGQQGE